MTRGEQRVLPGPGQGGVVETHGAEIGRAAGRERADVQAEAAGTAGGGGAEEPYRQRVRIAGHRRQHHPATADEPEV